MPGSDPSSLLDPHAFAIDRMAGNPTVDVAAVVADLDTAALQRLDQVKVLPAADLAQDDVADLERGRVHRGHGAQLPRLDLAAHGVAAGPERHRLAPLQPRDVFRRPTHDGLPPLASRGSFPW